MLRVAMLAAVLLAPLPAAGAPDAPADPALREVVRLVNRQRTRLGCRALRWNEPLARVAERHSRDMARRRYFSHQDKEGRSPFDRLERSGIRFQAAAENIAMGQETADAVFRDWMNSRGHRENMVNCRYTDVGIGLVNDHWTLELIQRPAGTIEGPRRTRQAGSAGHRTHRRTT
jgi:uncharacterized protein YkwD